MYYLLIPNKVLESVCSFHFYNTKQSLFGVQWTSCLLHIQVTVREVKWRKGMCSCPLQKHEIRLATLLEPLQYVSTVSGMVGEQGFCPLKSIPLVPSLRSLSIPPAFLSVGSEQWWNIFLHLGLLETPHVPFGFRDPPTNWNESHRHYPLVLKNSSGKGVDICKESENWSPPCWQVWEEAGVLNHPKP